FFFSSRRRHTRSKRDWSSDVCSSDLLELQRQSALRRQPVARFVGGADPSLKLPCDVKIDTALFMIRPSPGFLRFAHGDIASKMRSEERRVGKEGSTGRVQDH